MVGKRLFCILWAGIFVVYLVFLFGYRLYSDASMLSVTGAANFLTPMVIVGALVVSLLITIPIFQLLLSARSDAYRHDGVRPNSDPFVLPADAEAADAKARRKRVLQKQNAVSIKLWMLFVVLMSFVGLYLLFNAQPAVRGTPGPNANTDTATVATSTDGEASVLSPHEYTLGELPKFGYASKTPEQVAADQTYVAGMLESYGSFDAALDTQLSEAWDLFSSRQSDAAMWSFNLAWLLRATSSDALYGMGLVEGVRGNFEQSITLIEEAIALDPTRVAMQCDVARSYYFLATADGVGSSTTYLERAQDMIAAVDAADAMTPACYRSAAQIARARGDESGAQAFERLMSTQE